MANPAVEAALELINKSEHAKKLYDNGEYKLAQKLWLELFDEHEETPMPDVSSDVSAQSLSTSEEKPQSSEMFIGPIREEKSRRTSSVSSTDEEGSIAVLQLQERIEKLKMDPPKRTPNLRKRNQDQKLMKEDQDRRTGLNTVEFPAHQGGFDALENYSSIPSEIQKTLEDPTFLEYHIGPDEKTIRHSDYEIYFPKRSFKQACQVRVGVGMDFSADNEDYVTVTPVLTVESTELLQRPVKIRLKSWCVTSGDDGRAEVDILHRGEDKVWNTLTTVTLPKDAKDAFIEFSVDNFCLLKGCKDHHDDDSYLLSGLMCSNPDRATVIYYLHCDTLQNIFEKYATDTDQKYHLNTMIVKINDRITSTLAVENSEDGVSVTNGEHEFKIDETIIKAPTHWQHCFIQTTDAFQRSNKRVSLILRIKHNGEVVPSNQFSFILDCETVTGVSSRPMNAQTALFNSSGTFTEENCSTNVNSRSAGDS